MGASATLDAKLRQATDSAGSNAKDIAGSNAKDIAGKAITQIVKATGDNKQVLMSLMATDLDSNGGFAFFGLSLTVGAAASQISASIWGLCPKMAPASGWNQAAVVQVI